MTPEPISRIGAPPQAPRRKRKPRLALVALLAVVVGVVITAAGVMLPRALQLASDRLDAKTSPSPSPTPFKVTFDEHGACVLLIRTAKDGAEAINAIVEKPDGSTTDWAKLDGTVRDLHTVREVAPPDMISDIDIQLQPLEQLVAIHEGRAQSRTLKLEEYRAAGLRIVARCAKYAN